MTLEAEGMSATFLPSVGMLGVSLTWQGEEHLELGGGLDAWRAGTTVGMPLLHPWANRLSSTCYRVGDVEVDLDQGRALPRDGNDLLLHGTMVGAFAWEVLERSTTGGEARLSARFRYDDSAGTTFEAFPFPHDIVVDILVDGALSVCTTVRPTGELAVPLSFGWHPWFRIPGAARDDLVLLLPERRHLELDDRMIPTGRSNPEAPGEVSLRGKAFDDHYALDGRELAVRGAGRLITVAVDDGYRFAQVYAPVGSPVVCLEPMTARVDALVDGSCALVAPGETSAASFTASIKDA